MAAAILVAKDVTLHVTDTGTGIAPEDIPHLFERFWRGDRSRTRSTGGAGLGLSICKAVVDACSGSIVVNSEPSQGTCVTVRLPLVPVPSSDAAPQARQSAVR